MIMPVVGKAGSSNQLERSVKTTKKLKSKQMQNKAVHNVKGRYSEPELRRSFASMEM